MVKAVEAAGVPNMVWFNYRRVPADRAGEAARRRRPHRPAVPLSRDVPAGLDDLARRAAGRRGTVAAGRRMSLDRA